MTPDEQARKSAETLAAVRRMEDGRIADNPVSVDFASVIQRLSVDPFDGGGWEQYDQDVEGAAS